MLNCIIVQRCVPVLIILAKEKIRFNKCNCCLGLYGFAVLLASVLTAIVVGVSFSFTYIVDNELNTVYNATNPSEIDIQILDAIQTHAQEWSALETEFDCCGWGSLDDIVNNTCLNGTMTTNSTLEPCRDVFLQLGQDSAETMLLVSSATLLLMFFILISVCCLTCCAKKADVDQAEYQQMPRAHGGNYV